MMDWNKIVIKNNFPMPDFNINPGKCNIIGRLFFATALVVYSAPAFSQTGNLPADTAFARQNLWNAYHIYQKGNNDSAIVVSQRSIDIYKKYFGDTCLQVAEGYHFQAIFHAGKGRPDRSADLDLKALEITTRVVGKDDVRVSNILLNLGLWLTGIDTEKALEYLDECLRVRIKNYGANHTEVASVYSNISQIYREKQDNFKAIEYQLKGLSILEAQPKADSIAIASAYSSLGNVYGNIRQYDKVNYYYEKALAIRLAVLPPKHGDILRTYSNFGSWLLEQGRYDEALEYNMKALNLRLDALKPGHQDIATSYNNLGLVLDKIGQTDSAITCFRRAIDIRVRKLRANHPRIGSACFNLAECYTRQNNADSAIVYYYKAFYIQLENINDVGAECVVTLNKLAGALRAKGRHEEIRTLFENLEIRESPALYPVSLDGKVQLLRMKGRFFSNIYSKAHYSIEQALEPFEEMDRLLTSDQYLSWPQDLRAEFVSDVHDGYFAGAETCLQAAESTGSVQYLERAFDYAEKARAFLLYGKLKDESAKLKAGIPESLLQRERELYIDISYLEELIRKEKDKGPAARDSLTTVWSARLFDRKTDLDGFKKMLEKQYPRYYQLKYNLGAAGVKYLQDTLLGPEQALVEYFVGDSAILAFCVKRDTFYVRTIPRNFPLDTLIEDLHNALSEYGRVRNQSSAAVKRSVDRYIAAATALYDKLIAPLKSGLPHSLVIIPDGALGYIPFDALLEYVPTDRYDYGAFPYLGKKHLVNYCYSATLLREMKKEKLRQATSTDFIGFAPYYTGDTALLHSIYGNDRSVRKELKPLPFSGRELAAINDIMNGKAYFGADATKARFLSVASTARVIHLATHARADNRAGDYAWLAFSAATDSAGSTLLYLRELYNLILNADLVVLSACETGIGKLQAGEGIISLSRAFAYAGAKSIVTTLWSVDDEQSSSLMIAFYTLLSKGTPPDEALWRAKTDYLKSADVYAHPCYWAGFIGIAL
mgnify:CR=1 FL=1